MEFYIQWHSNTRNCKLSDQGIHFGWESRKEKKIKEKSVKVVENEACVYVGQE